MNRSTRSNDEKGGYRDHKQRDGDEVSKRYNTDAEGRRCRGNGRRSGGRAEKRRPDEEQKRHGDDGQKRQGGVWSRLGDRIVEDDEKRSSSPSEQKKEHDDEQKRMCDNDFSDSQSKRHKDNMSPPPINTIDSMYEMFKSFPPDSPTSTKSLDDKKPIRGRTWGEQMDAEVKPTNIATKEDQEAGINKENNPWKRSANRELETDKKRLSVRQRQIDIGKETEGYKKYVREVKRHERTLHHPRTPDKFTACSTRSWQGVIRVWRRKLHHWDPPEVAKQHQQKFANILTSPLHSDESGDDEEKENAKGIDTSIENKEDCILGEIGLKSKNNLHCSENITEASLFWSED